MLKMKNIIISVIVITLLIGCTNKPAIIITAADFGLSEQTDAVLAIRRALEACNANGAAKLIIPKGRYEFYPDHCADQYCIISNNDNGLKKIAFQLKGFKNFEIDASGSEFVFHGNMIPFNIDSASNIVLRNFSINWKRPFHSQGLVTAADPLHRTFDMAIDSEYTYHMEKDLIFFTGEGWIQDIQSNLFFDSATKAVVYNCEAYKLDTWNPLLNTLYGAKELKKGLVRITDTIAALPQPGWIWVTSGGREPNRRSPAIRIFGSKNVHLLDIDIFSAGGMGVIAERSEDMELKRFNVRLFPGSNRIVSTTADATHFVNCRGHIELDSCLFENMMDDATNVHGIYTRITKIVNPHTIEIMAVHGQQNVCSFAAAGDTIKVYDNETMDEARTLVVKGFNYRNEHYAEITFAEDISDLKINFGVDNYNWYPSFTMKNSTVQNNRARGILLATRKKVLIESNSFLNQMYAAIFIHGDMNYWYESGAVNDLTISNNYFFNSCTNSRNQSTILIEPKTLHPGSAMNCFHRNILIENNTIETFDNPVVDALAVDGLIIRGNKITQTNTFKPFYPDKPTINIRFSKNTLIENNLYSGMAKAYINTDEVSKSMVKIANNQNIK